MLLPLGNFEQRFITVVQVHVARPGEIALLWGTMRSRRKGG